MNPLEIIDIRQQQMLNTLNQDTYSNTEVSELLIKAFAFAKQAYVTGEFIFELESFSGEKVTIDNATYNITKMLTEDNKYMMFVQMLDIPEGDMTQTDMSQLANVLKKVAHNNPNINGVVLLPPNYEITLMSGKLNTSDYEIPEPIDEDILKTFSTLENNKNKSMNCRKPLSPDFTEFIKNIYGNHLKDSNFENLFEYEDEDTL